MSGIETLTTPAPVMTEPGDHDRFKHYVHKKALEQAILDGEPAVALCGKRWVPQRDPDRYPICMTCKEIFARLDWF